MKKIYLLVLVFCALATQGYAKAVLDTGCVHDALMNTEAPVSLLVVIDKEPPEPLQEQIPDQTDPQTIWIPGNWSWSTTREKFVWCCGLWRRPPPNHYWIPGEWKQTEGGWVRIQGFWSALPENQLTTISTPPPDPYDENPTNSPGKGYFWMSGYWKYERDHYTWLSGKWEALDPNWVYVPARYIWREGGYVFVAPFWDWPFELRGTAYACSSVSVGQKSIAYLPEMSVEPTVIVESFLLYYPDYYYFYFYHWYFHEAWWMGCDWCPPWWGWADWWWMPWGDHWGLWWWWTHPGFPGPLWLEVEMIGFMFAPPSPLIDAMHKMPPSLIIGKNGIIPTQKLLDTLGKKEPFFPKKYGKIQKTAGKELDHGSTRRPKGSRASHDKKGTPAPTAPQILPTAPEGATPGAQPSTPHTVVTAPPKPVYHPKPSPAPTREPTSPPRYGPPTTPRGEYPGNGGNPSPRRPRDPLYTPHYPQQDPTRGRVTPSYPQQDHTPTRDRDRGGRITPSYPQQDATRGGGGRVTPSYPSHTPSGTTPSYRGSQGYRTPATKR